MTKRETYCTIRGLKVWATAGLMLILVLSSGLALAAQIDITNCTGTKVKICSYDTKAHWPAANQGHILDAKDSTPDSGHFTCNANCYFMMTTTAVGHQCPGETTFNDVGWHKIDHSYGKGDYLLVGTEKTNQGNFKSANLTKGNTCP